MGWNQHVALCNKHVALCNWLPGCTDKQARSGQATLSQAEVSMPSPSAWVMHNQLCSLLFKEERIVLWRPCIAWFLPDRVTVWFCMYGTQTFVCCLVGATLAAGYVIWQTTKHNEEKSDSDGCVNVKKLMSKFRSGIFSQAADHTDWSFTSAAV